MTSYYVYDVLYDMTFNVMNVDCLIPKSKFYFTQLTRRNKIELFLVSLNRCHRPIFIFCFNVFYPLLYCLRLKCVYDLDEEDMDDGIIDQPGLQSSGVLCEQTSRVSTSHSTQSTPPTCASSAC